MNLERLPEIVEAVKPTRYTLNRRSEFGPMTLCVERNDQYGDTYRWRYKDGEAALCSFDREDTANACVVEMLRRAKTTCKVSFDAGGVSILEHGFSVWRTFPGDLLNALYDAFAAHPEWFKEPTNG